MELNKLHNYLENGRLPEDASEASRVVAEGTCFAIVDGVIDPTGNGWLSQLI